MKAEGSNYKSLTYLAISGGVGGAKLALGFSHLLGKQLSVVTNTGDDFTHFGLNICPDLDTVMYTLADLNDKTRGWGLANETWNFLDAMSSLGKESWFQLGDRDLATHITRTQLLNDGMSLSDVTEYLCNELGIEAAIFPMSDETVSTSVGLKDGSWLSFQHYFVKEQCAPEVTDFKFEGINKAKPSPLFQAALEDSSLGATFICPSNPFVSVDPVLSLPGVSTLLQEHPAPVIAISPIVGGQAIKGPTAKMMKELDMPQSALTVAKHYGGRSGGGLLDGYVLDNKDSHLAEECLALGIKTLVTNTVMVSLDDRIKLADDCLEFSEQIKKS